MRINPGLITHVETVWLQVKTRLLYSQECFTTASPGCVCTLLACCLTTKMIFFFPEWKGFYPSLWCNFTFFISEWTLINFYFGWIGMNMPEDTWVGKYQFGEGKRLTKLTLDLSRIKWIIMNIHGPKMIYWLWWAPDAPAGSYSVV